MRMQFYCSKRNPDNYHRQQETRKHRNTPAVLSREERIPPGADPKDLILKQKIEAAIKKAADNEKLVHEIECKVMDYEVLCAIARDLKRPDEKKRCYKELIAYLNNIL